MVNYSTSHLDLVFGALSDATRRAILERLAEGEANVTELAEPFDMSLPAITKHLNVLESAGLIHRARDGRVRRCTLETTTLREASAWIDKYRRFWETQLDSLAEYLRQSTDKEPENDDDAGEE